MTDVYGAYRQVLAEEITRKPVEWTFKSNPAYRQILEHVTPEQGEQYIAVMQRDFPGLWRMCKRTFLDTAIANDSVGWPVQADFDSLGITCSPTNFRYMWQALSIVSHIQRDHLDPQHIVEIGGGYGGLALYLRWAFGNYVLSHTIIDLPEAGAIQQAFAAEMGIGLRAVDASDTEVIAALHGYLVSAYGFSEFDSDTRAMYEEMLIPNCPHGFMVWNMSGVYSFTSALYSVADEDPLTGHGNKVITW